MRLNAIPRGGTVCRRRGMKRYRRTPIELKRWLEARGPLVRAEERRVVQVPVRREVRAFRGIGVVVVVATAIPLFGEGFALVAGGHPSTSLVVGATVVRAHDVVLVAVPRAGRMRRGVLHRAHVVA